MWATAETALPRGATSPVALMVLAPGEVEEALTRITAPDREEEEDPPEAPPTGAVAAERDWDALAPRGAYPQRVRPVLERLLLAAVLPVALALGLPIALVNWLSFGDRRKVFFRQPRVGHRGRVFEIVKFRTMKETTGGSFDSWRDGEDGLRVTRLGRFLRNAHLDELPQILNVLRGEMSFVGPRPEMIEIDSWAREHVPGFERRLAVKPGITGLSQVTQGYTGMDPRAYAAKLAGDERYLAELSFRLDLAIVLRTALWMLRGRGWRWREQGRAA